MLHSLKLELTNDELYNDKLDEADSLKPVHSVLKEAGKEAIALGAYLLSSLDTTSASHPVTAREQLQSMRNQIELFNNTISDMPYFKKLDNPTKALANKARVLIPILTKIISDELDYVGQTMKDLVLNKKIDTFSKSESLVRYSSYMDFLKKLNNAKQKPGESARSFYDDLYSRYSWNRKSFLERNNISESEWFKIVVPAGDLDTYLK